MINQTDISCNRKIILTNRLVRFSELPLLIDTHSSALNHIAVLYEGPFCTNIVYRKCIDSVRRKIFKNMYRIGAELSDSNSPIYKTIQN